jgi:hypothetical protein
MRVFVLRRWEGRETPEIVGVYHSRAAAAEGQRTADAFEQHTFARMKDAYPSSGWGERDESYNYAIDEFVVQSMRDSDVDSDT